jgi:hypothetical protein
MIEPCQVTPWLTKREAAARARVHPATIQRAMRDGRLQFSGGRRSGGAPVLIRVEWLDEWVELRETTEGA